MCDGAVRGMTLRRIRPEMYNWWNGLRQVFTVTPTGGYFPSFGA